MRAAIVVGAVLLGPLAGARAGEMVDAGPAIDRGLAFLAKDALAWKAEHNCASCHHAALVVWAMREARQHGHKVDEPVLADLTAWLADSGDGKTNQARPPGRPKAANTKAVFYALALGSDPAPTAPAREGLARLLGTVESDQTGDGSWSSWPETRPPMFGDSDDSLTALATLTLLPAAESGDSAARAARDKGVQWLASTKTDDDPPIGRPATRPLGPPGPTGRRARGARETDQGTSERRRRLVAGEGHGG